MAAGARPKRLRANLLAAVALSLCTCTGSLSQSEPASFERVRAYVNSPMGQDSDVFSGVFYVGSDDDFDYLVIEHRSFAKKAFKVRRGELGIAPRMSRTADEKRWVDVTWMFLAQTTSSTPESTDRHPHESSP